MQIPQNCFYKGIRQLSDFDGVVGADFVATKTVDAFFAGQDDFVGVTGRDLDGLDRADVDAGFAAEAAFFVKDGGAFHAAQAWDTL